MNPQEIKELINEVKKSPTDHDPMRRAELLASLLTAYHTARIAEHLEKLSKLSSPEIFQGYYVNNSEFLKGQV